MNLKETGEVYEFLKATLVQLTAAKKTDGKVTLMELLNIAAALASPAVASFEGLSLIDDELKDLDAEEVKLLAGWGVELMQAFAALIMAKAEAPV